MSVQERTEELTILLESIVGQVMIDGNTDKETFGVAANSILNVLAKVLSVGPALDDWDESMKIVSAVLKSKVEFYRDEYNKVCTCGNCNKPLLH